MHRALLALPLFVIVVGCTPARSPEVAQVKAPDCAAGTAWDGFECVKKEAEAAPSPTMSVASSTAVPLPPTTPDEVLYQEALERHAADDSPAMRKKLFTIIQQFPKSPRVGDAYYWFGMLFFDEARNGNASMFELAKAGFEHALTYPQAETAPDNLLHLAMTYDAVGNAGASAHTYSTLRIQHPQSAAAHSIPAGH